MKVYLRLGADALTDAKRYRTKADAIAAFKAVAEELDRYGQRIEGTLHFARNREELAEYPDRLLELTARGTVKESRT